MYVIVLERITRSDRLERASRGFICESNSLYFQVALIAPLIMEKLINLPLPNHGSLAVPYLVMWMSLCCLFLCIHGRDMKVFDFGAKPT